MKKLILSAAAVLVLTTAVAQKNGASKAVEQAATPVEETSQGTNYLPEKGDWAIGFSAGNLLNNLAASLNGNKTTGTDNAIHQKNASFTGKYFYEANKAYRVTLNIGMGSTSDTEPTLKGADKYESKTTTSAFDVKLGLGKEWRRGKTRLQGYYGADVFLGFNSGKKTTIKESRVDPLKANTAFILTSSEQTIKSGSGISVGAIGFIGAEYFILPKLALGAQYQWGIEFQSNGASSNEKTETTVQTNNSAAVTKTDITSSNSEGGKSSTFNLGGSGKDSNSIGVGTASLILTLHF